MIIKINKKLTIDTVLRASGTAIDGKYYHLPLWFEANGDSFIVHHVEDLPDRIKKLVRDRKRKNFLSRIFKTKKS